MTGLFLAVAETSLLTGLTAVALIALLPRLRLRYAARGRRLVWLLLTLRLLLPVPFPRPAAAPVTITLPGAVSRPLDLSAPAASVQTAPALPSAPAAFTMPTPLALLALLWLAGALCVLFWQVSGYLRFRRELARWAVPVEDGSARRILAELSARMGLRRTPALLLDRQGRGPLLAGFLRPAIVLPETGLPEEELRFILAHELTHYRHGDLWFRLLLLLAAAVHWFNPAVWLLRQAAVADLELACDDGVLAAAGEGQRRAYCEAILKAVHRGKTQNTILTTSFQGGVRGMKQRFVNIFQSKKKRGLWLALPVVALALLLGGLVSCTTAPEDDSTPADVTTPAVQPNTHHPETHNPDHHTSEYHYEEHHSTEVDLPSYQEREPGDTSLVQNVPAGGTLPDGLPLEQDVQREPEGSYAEVGPEGYVETDPDPNDEPNQLGGQGEINYDEALQETALGFAAAYFSNDIDRAAAWLTDDAPRELYGSDIWTETELTALKYGPDSLSANSFLSLQVECILNGEDSFTYLGLELTPTAEGWLVRDFWLEK